MERVCTRLLLLHGVRWWAVPALAALSLLLFAAPQAQADSCSQNFTDSLGYRWDVTSGASGTTWGGAPVGGFIDQGGIAALPPGFAPNQSEAYDGWGVLKVDDPGSPAAGGYYVPTDLSSCTREDSAREVVLPAKAIDGFEVQRKIYVPASGLGFVRFLDVIKNTGATTKAAAISFEGDLGSDGATRIRATSDGDSTYTPADRWATSEADPALVDPLTFSADPPTAHVWDGPGGLAAVSVFGGNTPTLWGDGDQRPIRVVYAVPSIAAGETVILMHFEAQRSSIAGALTAAQNLGDAKASGGEGFAFMDETTELGKLLNWDKTNFDGDGVANGSDNCRFTANTNQADLDGDGSGDACDDDIDGDGLSNAAEAALGTSPTSVDTDGDGYRDGADACPVTAGQKADGCPVTPPPPPPPPPPAPDTTAPSLTLSAPRSIKRRLFVKGLTSSATANESCSLKFELLGSLRPGKPYKRSLARQLLPMGKAGTRAVRMRPSRKAVSRSRRFTVQLRVTAIDSSGNRSVKTKLIKVK
jgi:hypothetical protein